MGAATALPVTDVRVEPGDTATTTMRVRNTGQVVDQYTIDIVGDCAEWTRVEPKIVNLLPGADVEVTITFAPARSPEVPAGVIPYGVRVMSREDPSGSAVAEGNVEVAPFDDVQVELVPRQSKGRRKGKHQVAIDNNGNTPTTVQVTAQDEEENLDFKLDHSVATIEPGAAAFIRLKAIPEKRFLKGADRQHAFVVTVVPNNASPVATRGTMTQRQLLPAWLLPVIAALVALAVLLFVLYETILKPKINSEAKDAAFKEVKKQNSSLASKAAAAQNQAAAANAAAKKAQSDASSAQKAAAGGAAANPKTTPVTGPGGQNIDAGTATAFSVQANATETTNATSFTVTPGITIPSNKVLVVTYMILQNPYGDAGTLQVRRGDTTLLTEGLANFRDLDHPFQVEPLIFTSSEPVNIAVNCSKAATGSTCKPSVLFTGRLADKKTAGG